MLDQQSGAVWAIAAFVGAWLSGWVELPRASPAHDLECYSELQEVLELSRSVRWWRRAAYWGWCLAAAASIVACLSLAFVLHWSPWRASRSAASVAAVQVNVVAPGSQLAEPPRPAVRTKSRFADGGGVLETRSQGVREVPRLSDLA